TGRGYVPSRQDCQIVVCEDVILNIDIAGAIEVCGIAPDRHLSQIEIAGPCADLSDAGRHIHQAHGAVQHCANSSRTAVEVDLRCGNSASEDGQNGILDQPCTTDIYCSVERANRSEGVVYVDYILQAGCRSGDIDICVSRSKHTLIHDEGCIQIQII